MKKYIISEVTPFDEDQQRFYTHVGIDAKGKPLHYTVWGSTEIKSRKRAEDLAAILTGENRKK